jgi:membrane-associated phospholipid phosphatase
MKCTCRIRHYSCSSEANRKLAVVIFRIPSTWEKAWQSFDDPIIEVCQSFSAKWYYLLNVIISALTTVEVGVLCPFACFSLGLDEAGTVCLCYVMAVCFISQIPKRFVWRTRPFLAGRAKKVRSDKTSSFPSRAVTCGFLFPCMFMTAFLAQLFASMPQLMAEPRWELFLVLTCLGLLTFVIAIISALLSANARVSFGVHYPSDCVAGTLQGMLCTLVALFAYLLVSFSCGSCMLDQCYGTLSLVFVDPKFVSVTVLLVGILLGCTVLSVIQPIKFWVKCHHVYGMLFPPLTFRLLYLCPNFTGSAFPAPHILPPYCLLVLVVGLLLGTGVGMGVKKWPISAYCVIYFSLTAMLVALRVSSVWWGKVIHA